MEQHYYEKTLSKTDVEQKLIVQMEWLGNFLPVPIPGSEAIPILVKDELGKDYTFRLTVRSLKPGELRYDMKPEFMFKEWHAFVVEKKLQVGESIYLWWDVRGHIRIKVQVPGSASSLPLARHHLPVLTYVDLLDQVHFVVYSI